MRLRGTLAKKFRAFLTECSRVQYRGSRWVFSEDDFIAPLWEVEVIEEKILLRNRDPLSATSRAAMRTSAQHSREHYREGVANAAPQALAENVPAHSSICRGPHIQACQLC